MQREPSGSEKFLQKLTAAIYNLRYILIGFLSVLVIFAITWAIVAEVRSNKTEASTILAERAEKKLEQWIDEEDEEARATIAEDLFTDLTRIIDEYPKLYAGQRAYQILGSLYFRTEQWESAAEAFLDLADAFPKSYLAPIALINAAVAYEESEQPELAYESYRRVSEDFATASPEIPRVLFALGRLSETIGTEDQAREYYDRLVDEHAASSWTNLARDRIIYLNLD